VLLKHLWRRGEAATTPVGLVPLGTGNDFARGVGIPLDHIEAARLVRTGRPRPVDLIVDDSGGVVVNAVHVGAGAGAAVKARPLERRSRAGRRPSAPGPTPPTGGWMSRSPSPPAGWRASGTPWR
jgi:diacylglycerol kinase (ATP)